MTTTPTPSAKTVTLTLGYKGGPGDQPRRTVVIGRRLTGADLMAIGDQPESRSPTQLNLSLIAAAITEFGDLPIPVPLTVLLSLKSIDREDLAAAYAKFVEETAGGGTAARLTDTRYRLARGFEIGGVVYDVVEFGDLLTGYDELEAEEFEGWRRACFLIGKQIGSISQSAGAARLEGPVAVESFEPLDAEDIYSLNDFVGKWKDSFRSAARAALQQEAGAGGGDSAAAPARLDGGDGSQPQS
jgi:hypothetical protein